MIADNESLDRKFVLQSLQEAGKVVSKCTSRESLWADALPYAPLKQILSFHRTFFFQSSRSRRALALPKISDPIARQVALESAPEGFLFGKDLAERYRSAKSVADAGKKTLYAPTPPAGPQRISGNGNGQAGKRLGPSGQTARRADPKQRRCNYKPRNQPYPSRQYFKPAPQRYRKRV